MPRLLTCSGRDQTCEEALQSLYPLVGEHGMDYMFKACSTTARCVLLPLPLRLPPLIVCLRVPPAAVRLTPPPSSRPP